MNKNICNYLRQGKLQVPTDRRVLLIADFDGTLTPIVARPEQATLAPEVRGLLVELGSNPHCVIAVLSGRAVDDVEARVNVPGLIYAGNHGLEMRSPHLHFVEPIAAASAPALRELTDNLQAALARVPGVLVENKHLTASVHVRLVPEDLRAEVREIVEYWTHSTPFHLTTGHAVIELRPPVTWNKGTAALWIRDHCAADADPILVLGDDLTDEDAFVALPDAITVKVGDNTATAAQYSLASPDEVACVLSWLRDVAAGDRRQSKNGVIGTH
jgi:trehalose 6-phosphate phosphatase